jgi:hypothetical protein
MKYGALFAVLALAGPASAQSPPPQQPAPTRATFVSTNEARWDVWVDQQPACATPCTIGLLPLQFVALRTQERNPIRLDVGRLPQGDLMVSAKPLSEGLYAGGIIMTTFSGMGVATGVTLTAVGCSTDHPTLCKAGIITTIPSAIGLYVGIYWMRKALPHASIGRAQPFVASNQVGLTGTF